MYCFSVVNQLLICFKTPGVIGGNPVVGGLEGAYSPKVRQALFFFNFLESKP